MGGVCSVCRGCPRVPPPSKGRDGRPARRRASRAHRIARMRRHRAVCGEGRSRPLHGQLRVVVVGRLMTLVAAVGGAVDRPGCMRGRRLLGVDVAGLARIVVVAAISWAGHAAVVAEEGACIGRRRCGRAAEPCKGGGLGGAAIYSRGPGRGEVVRWL